MTGKPCPEGCECGRHLQVRPAWPVPYVLTEKAERELARWDAWKRQREEAEASHA